MIDPFGRSITYLRVSVTDRCDLRCVYCMAEDMSFLPKRELLTLEELDRVCAAFIRLGTNKIRITGGEPLVRRDVMRLFQSLGARLGEGGLQELVVTTNGTQLAKHAEGLYAAGVRRINVSLDTLDPEKFAQITRWGKIGATLDGIFAAKDAGTRHQDQRRGDEGRERGRVRQHARLVRRSRVRPVPDRDHADGRHHRRPDRAIPAAVDRALAAAPALDAGGHGLSHRRSGAVFQRGGDRAAGRLHHADDAQFLRELQPRAAYLHRHLYMCLGQDDAADFRSVLRDGATDAELDDAIREAISRKPKGHDFIIDRRHDRPAVARHMSVTGG